MTDNKDDKMVERFLMEHSGEMADNGFSRRVMRSLPDRALRYNRIWTAVYAVVVVILMVKLKAFTMLYSNVCDMAANMVGHETEIPDVKILLLSAAVLAVVAGWNKISDEFL